jgi:hypothetical protein
VKAPALANFPPDVTGEWERVGPIYTLAAPASSISFSGLTGDSVGGYRIRGWGNVTTASGVNLNINGAATNMVASMLYTVVASVAAFSHLSFNFVAAGRYEFEIEFRNTASGANRGAGCKSWYYDPAANNTYAMMGAVAWEDSATVVTALSVVQSAGLFATGFKYEIARRVKD